MTRTVVTASIAALLLIATTGCRPNDPSLAQRLPQRTTYASPAVTGDANAASMVSSSTDEIDLVEQVATHRRAYRQSLVLLVQHYNVVGNNRKLRWAEEELRSLDRMPQYRYIIDAEVLPPSLQASERIPNADTMYLDAVETQREAEPIGILKDEELLRVALDKYNQMVRKYPNSDKIDDAAYRMAGIYEYFKDYEIALLCYQRAYQWDPDTPYPARFMAAQILDKRLHRRAEALELYKEAVLREAKYEDWKSYGERRIKELSQSVE
jgi:tetratricopeptide (TPR) repeat protein